MADGKKACAIGIKMVLEIVHLNALIINFRRQILTHKFPRLFQAFMHKIKNSLNWFTNQSNWFILNKFEWFLKIISVTELIISIIELIIS